MIDFYWLKSFTEILQLFISIFFLVFLRVKYRRWSVPLQWLVLFFSIKLISDLYGILNYTSWISTIITRPVLSIFRLTMGTVEMGMLISFILMVHSAYRQEVPLRRGAPWFGLALLLFPVNWVLQFHFQSDLTIMFDLIKLLWIGGTVYTLRLIREKHLRRLAFCIIMWNTLWLTEVVLHQQLALISESLSWTLFVLAELLLTIGLAYYLIRVITDSRIIRFEKVENLLPKLLQRLIQSGLKRTLDQEKAYLDADLTVAKLAGRIGIPTPDLTRYLNRILEKNVNQLLIDYRIEESKRLLHNPAYDHYTIEAIMYKSGFRSKSVFNTAFKERVGVTPSVYRKGG